MADTPDYKTIKKLKIKAFKGHKLTFAERNLILMYDKRIIKEDMGPTT